MGVGDTFVPTPVGVFFGPEAEDAGQDRARPLLRRCGARPHRLHRMRRVHDRMPLRRQEHTGEELPGPGGKGWGRSHSDDDGDRLPAARRRTVGGRARCAPAAGLRKTRKTYTATPRGAGGGHLRYAEAAVQDARQGQAAQAVRQARRADAHQLGVDRRRGHARRSTPISTSPTAWRSRRRSTRRPTPISSRCATARAPTRWACCRR